MQTDEISGVRTGEKKMCEIKKMKNSIFVETRITLKYEYIHILLEEAFSY